MFRVWKAARVARDYLASTKDESGSYRLASLPEVASPGGRGRDIAAVVARLRMAGRLLAGFLDPVDDAIFLAVGLRKLGFDARFHLGRELVPAQPPAGYYAWVSFEGAVVSTSIPVRQEYVDVGLR